MKHIFCFHEDITFIIFLEHLWWCIRTTSPNFHHFCSFQIQTECWSFITAYITHKLQYLLCTVRRDGAVVTMASRKRITIVSSRSASTGGAWCLSIACNRVTRDLLRGFLAWIINSCVICFVSSPAQVSWRFFFFAFFSVTKTNSFVYDSGMVRWSVFWGAEEGELPDIPPTDHWQPPPSNLRNHPTADLFEWRSAGAVMLSRRRRIWPWW